MVPARLLGFCGGRFTSLAGEGSNSSGTAQPTFLPPTSTAELSSGPSQPASANTGDGSSAIAGISVAAVLLLLLLLVGLVLRRQVGIFAAQPEKDGHGCACHVMCVLPLTPCPFSCR
jgi:hypothetical protein